MDDPSVVAERGVLTAPAEVWQLDLGEAERHALRRGRTVRHGLGYSLHVTALPEVHQALLAAAAALDTDGATSADRKAYRIYADRFNSTAGCVAAAQQAQ